MKVNWIHALIAIFMFYMFCTYILLGRGALDIAVTLIAGIGNLIMAFTNTN